MCVQSKLDCLGIGLSLPGTVDLERGILVFAPNLGWRNVPLKDIFFERTGMKVYVENDANAGAIAEHLFGAARKSDDFIFVVLGIGIGGGLFLNGNLYRGKDGFAGEIGHTPIAAEPYQNPCHCGKRGCWETYANQNSIIKRVQEHIRVNQNSASPILLKEPGDHLTISDIKEAADQGDKAFLDSLTETGTALGLGFASLIDIFNPEKIILGGPLSVVGNYLLPAIIESATSHSLINTSPNTDILLSSFETDAVLLGAISVVVDDILSRPTSVERR
jgi:glucokinase-like ROK family protein